jgi:hypothetical protein
VPSDLEEFSLKKERGISLGSKWRKAIQETKKAGKGGLLRTDSSKNCFGCRHFEESGSYCLLRRKKVNPYFGKSCSDFGRKGL